MTTALIVRGAVVGLAAFAIVYCALSGVVAALAKASLWKRRSAGTLYAVATAPLWGALLVVALFTLPAFLAYEPREGAEAIGWVARGCAGLSIALLATGLWRGARNWIEAARFCSRILQRSVPMRTQAGELHVFRDEHAVVLVTGVLRPTVLVSTAALSLLDEDELDVAVRHEFAHARSGDNLRKLVLGLCAFPGTSELERLWAERAEMAADTAAARSQAAALDLASALVKMAARAPYPAPELSIALATGGEAVIAARVNALMSGEMVAPRSLWKQRAMFLLGLGLVVALEYGFVLGRVHELSELLLR